MPQGSFLNSGAVAEASKPTSTVGVPPTTVHCRRCCEKKMEVFPVIGLLSSRPPFGRIEPAAEIGSRATDGRPSSKRSPISL